MDSSRSAREQHLIGLIYDAVSDATLWPAFLYACCEHVGGLSASFAIRDVFREEFSVGCFSGWSDQDVRIFMERYAAIDPLAHYASFQPEGIIVPDYEFCPREVAEASAAFREFYIPRDRMHSFGGMILCTSAVQSFISFQRGAAGGPFEPADCAMLRPLLPHLRRAALLHDELQNLRMRNAALTGHLERFPQALCLLDVELRVLYHNSAAATVLARRDGFQIEAGRLVPSSHSESAALAAAVQTALGRATAGRATVARGSGRGASYRVFFFPLPGGSQLTFGATHPVLAALIVDAGAPPGIDTALIRELFGLTRAESQVAVKLTQGLAPSEIAAELSVSVETVRTHLRRILAKTGTSRQGSLVSLILRSAPFQRL